MRYLKWLLVFSVVVAAAIFLLGWNLKRTTVNTYNRNIAKAPYDVIIVPGLPYDSAQQNTLFKVRMLWAKNLFDKGIAKNIIFSGGAVHTCWQEGTVMKVLADSLGIPANHTFAELRAEHGNQNVYYSYRMAQQLGFKTVALATDQYQNAFLTSYIQKQLPGVAQLPVTVDSFPVYNKIQLPRIDATCARVDSFVPLNERKSRLERYRSSFSNEVKE